MSTVKKSYPIPGQEDILCYHLEALLFYLPHLNLIAVGADLCVRCETGNTFCFFFIGHQIKCL